MPAGSNDAPVRTRFCFLARTLEAVLSNYRILRIFSRQSEHVVRSKIRQTPRMGYEGYPGLTQTSDSTTAIAYHNTPNLLVRAVRQTGPPSEFDQDGA